MAERGARNSGDRRVKRTKKLLRECLFSLLEDKPASEITVRDLTEKADINRSTFYFYYKDINDMIIHIQDEIYGAFEKEVLEPEASFVTPDDFAAYCTRFLDFLKNNSEICRFVMRNDPGNTLSTKVRLALLEKVPDSTLLFSEEDPRYYLTTFAVSGIWQSVLGWMYDGMKVPPEELAPFLANVYFYGGRAMLTRTAADG